MREATETKIQESGGQVLESFPYDPNASDYTKEVQRVKDLDPDAIVLIGFTGHTPSVRARRSTPER